MRCHFFIGGSDPLRSGATADFVSVGSGLNSAFADA